MLQGMHFVFAVCCCCVMRGFVFFFLCLLDKGIQNWRNIQSTDQINLKQSLFLFHVLFYDYGCHITSVELLSFCFCFRAQYMQCVGFLFSFLVSQKSILFINANIISCILSQSSLFNLFVNQGKSQLIAYKFCKLRTTFLYPFSTTSTHSRCVIKQVTKHNK